MDPEHNAFVETRIQKWKRLERTYGKDATEFTRKIVDTVDYYNCKAAVAPNFEEAKKAFNLGDKKVGNLVDSTTDRTDNAMSKELHEEIQKSLLRSQIPHSRRLTNEETTNIALKRIRSRNRKEALLEFENLKAYSRLVYGGEP